MSKVRSLYILLCLFVFCAPHKLWAKTKEYHLILANHVFTPSELKIPATEKVKLIIHNKDDVAEEFDSFDLNREKVLFPFRKTTIFIGPLPPGKYEYFGEFNPNSARGIVIVRATNSDSIIVDTSNNEVINAH